MNSIKKFYENQEIFLTGATGFVGLFVVEKLLKSCSGLKKIYLLMRSKGKVSAAEELAEKIKDAHSYRLQGDDMAWQGQRNLLT